MASDGAASKNASIQRCHSVTARTVPHIASKRANVKLTQFQ